jgi:hypothetical protein
MGKLKQDHVSAGGYFTTISEDAGLSAAAAAGGAPGGGDFTLLVVKISYLLRITFV